MAKPKPADVWRCVPVEGKPIWFPTPSDQSIPGIEKEAEWSVEENGEGDTDGEGYTHIRSPEEQIKLFELPEGYQVNLFASEVRFPIANPMAIQFDARGRLWVANTPTWPHPLPRKQPQDSIVILADTDRDGIADSHTVFLDHLNLLHGFGIVGGDAYIAQTPNLVVARDTDGALYVADFYSHIFENVNFSKRHPGRDHSHGRIWRITYKDRPLLNAPKIVG